MESKPKPDDAMPSLDAMSAAEPTVWLAFTAAPAHHVEDLARRVSSGHVADRREATRELATLLRRDRSAIRPTLGALELALRDADAQVRISAMEALAHVVAAGVPPPSLRPTLVGLFRDELVVVRRAALARFVARWPNGWDPDERTAIATVLSDPDAAMRIEASAALRRAVRAGDDLGPRIPTLLRAIDDAEPTVRANALAALDELVERDRDDAARALGALLHRDAPRSDQARALIATCRRVLREPSSAERSADTRDERRPPERDSATAAGDAAQVRPWWARALRSMGSVLRRILEGSAPQREHTDPAAPPAVRRVRPDIESWGRGVSKTWSNDLLRSRRFRLERWRPESADDMELKRRWVGDIELTMQARHLWDARRAHG